MNYPGLILLRIMICMELLRRRRRKMRINVKVLAVPLAAGEEEEGEVEEVEKVGVEKVGVEKVEEVGKVGEDKK